MPDTKTVLTEDNKLKESPDEKGEIRHGHGPDSDSHTEVAEGKAVFRDKTGTWTLINGTPDPTLAHFYKHKELRAHTRQEVDFKLGELLDKFDILEAKWGEHTRKMGPWTPDTEEITLTSSTLISEAIELDEKVLNLRKICNAQADSWEAEPERTIGLSDTCHATSRKLAHIEARNQSSLRCLKLKTLFTSEQHAIDWTELRDEANQHATFIADLEWRIDEHAEHIGVLAAYLKALLPDYDETSSSAEKCAQDKLKEEKKVLRTIKNQDSKIIELNEKIALKDRALEEVESGIRARELDAKLREEAVKEKERKLNSQPLRVPQESHKSAAKQSKAANGVWKSQLEVAQGKAIDLENQLQRMTAAKSVLELDYNATVAELEALKIKQTEDTSDDTELAKLKEDRDKFRGLYEANRTNDQIVGDKVKKAVREAKANFQAEFEAWKARALEIIRATDEKYLDAEGIIRVAENMTKEVLARAGSAPRVDAQDELMLEKGQVLTDLLEENKAKDEEIAVKDAEIARLKAAISDLIRP